MTHQLRIVVFSPSIISDIGNPQATTVRAMCQALVERGHDVTHLEERGNPWLDRMLRLRGYAPMRAFNERFPLVRYRQYTIPKGMERSIWFGREVATADALIAYPGSPSEVIEEVAAFDVKRLLRFWSESVDEARELLPLWFEPAVLPHIHESERSGTLAVAYDNAFSTTPDLERLTLGSLSDPDWTFRAEILIPETYSSAKVVQIGPLGNDPFERARALLPLAYGASVDLVAGNGQITERIESLPDIHNARLRAAKLEEAIDPILHARLVAAG